MVALKIAIVHFGVDQKVLVEFINFLLARLT